MYHDSHLVFELDLGRQNNSAERMRFASQNWLALLPFLWMLHRLLRYCRGALTRLSASSRSRRVLPQRVRVVARARQSAEPLAHEFLRPAAARKEFARLAR